MHFALIFFLFPVLRSKIKFRVHFALYYLLDDKIDKIIVINLFLFLGNKNGQYFLYREHLLWEFGHHFLQVLLLLLKWNTSQTKWTEKERADFSLNIFVSCHFFLSQTWQGKHLLWPGSIVSSTTFKHN